MEPSESGRRVGWALAATGALAVLVAVAILLDLGPFADEELTRGELIARGDQICEQAHEAFSELQSEPPRTGREAADLTSQLAGIAEDERDEIDELNGPDDLDPAIDGYLAARDRGIEALRRGNEAAEEGDSGAYERHQAELAKSQLERRRMAREIGFSECSRPLVDREELAEQARAPAAIDPDAPPTVSNPPGQ
jgi:hypothetical protein